MARFALPLSSLTLRVVFWIVVPMALASAISVFIAHSFAEKPMTLLSLRLNNSFGAGAQAIIDAVRVWVGKDWLLDDSWRPMLRALHHIESSSASSLYETLFFSDRTKFQYPPMSLLPLEALGRVMPLTPRALNAVNSLVLLANAIAVAFLAYLVFGNREFRVNASATTFHPVDAYALAFVAFCAAWAFDPITQAFSLGQIQLWIDLAFTLACVLWLLDRKIAAGLVVGLASTIKPQLALLVLWALAWKEWNFARGFICSALPVALLSIGRYGWSNHIEYLDVLSYISQHGEAYYKNNSVNGLINRLLSNGSSLQWDAANFAPYNPYVHAATLLTGIAFVLLPFAVALFNRHRSANFFDFGAAALCFTLASPVAWEHHYGIMLPLFIAFLGFALQRASPQLRKTLLIVLALSWVLSAGRYVALDLLSASALSALQSHLFFGALMLLALLLSAAPHVASAPIPQEQSGGLRS